MSNQPPIVTKERARIAGPLDPMIPVLGWPGVPFGLPVVADLPEGGFLQIVPGANPLGQAVPGVQLAPGSMLVVLAPEVAVLARGAIRQQEAKHIKGVGKPD